ncbi:hypothetical protein Tco_0266733 [Tanacetum coccineum]
MSMTVCKTQDGERLQDDDQRLDLADDLKKAQDHISSTHISHKTKSTTSMYKISHEESTHGYALSSLIDTTYWSLE